MKKRKKKKSVIRYQKALKFWNDYEQSKDLSKKNPIFYLRVNGGEQLHRKIKEIVLGRKLTREEVVHHLDENKHNCHPKNLVLCADQDEHLSKYHSKHYDSELIQKLITFGKDKNISRKIAADLLNISESLVKKMIKILNFGVIMQIMIG